MSSGTPMVSEKDVRHAWFVVDATDQVLGRLATRVAKGLSGKHRQNWVPYPDTGDVVVGTNDAKVGKRGMTAEDKREHRPRGKRGGRHVGAGGVQSHVRRAGNDTGESVARKQMHTASTTGQ